MALKVSSEWMFWTKNHSTYNVIEECCYNKLIVNKLGLSRAELSQARACLEVSNFINFVELSTYHLKVTLSAMGLASEILIGLAS